MKTVLSQSSLARKFATDKLADTLMLYVLIVYCFVTIGLAFFKQHHGSQLIEAIISSLIVLGIGVFGYVLYKGKEPCRYFMAVTLMLMVALHIHFAMGMIEFHFGVFVTLALLLMYRDWRPIMVAAVVIAIHHVVVDRLQAAGFEIFCLEEANFKQVMIHAAYVVVQTGFQIKIAMMLKTSEMNSYLLSDRLQIAMDNLNVAVSEVKTHSASVFESANTIATTGEYLTEKSSNASIRLHQTAVTIEELGESITENEQIATSADKLITSAANEAREGRSLVNEIVKVMSDIEVSASKISAITEVINGISFQTNILALNAAVEAARAGEQGRGFAVVASEVRTLAQRAGQAAKEIEVLIDTSVTHMKEGVKFVNSANTTISSMAVSVEDVSGLVSSISKNTESQSLQVQVVNQSLKTLEEVVKDNDIAAKNSVGIALDLQSHADALNTSIAKVDLDNTIYDGEQEVIIGDISEHN
ncbi:methyl-accepting chemotaxis protein [Thorsellia anophelis]|uniref:Methyl-accepting chemotaxis protein n=1 Tax=Thorsellia anophelis DSM 18579 TaxID=1123402 RepID=A0A1I0BQW8_9GAMM|nr:methyl-accepting chemotaxis protein [Thorsellia anophelis]SET09032.1 methyl-accepting chemotaxis protein [Thorsellia anophelis DSM 18579]